jgi:transposase-like protein
MMAHHSRIIRKQVFALVEEGRLSVSAAGRWYGVPGSMVRAWLQKYRMDGQVGRC